MKKLFVLLLIGTFGLTSFAYQIPAKHPVSIPASVKQEKKEKKKEKKEKKKEKKRLKSEGKTVVKPKDGHGVGNGAVQPEKEKQKHPPK
jgi:hypothetical protein